MRRLIGMITAVAFAAMIVYGGLFQRVEVFSGADRARKRELGGGELISASVRRTIARNGTTGVIVEEQAGDIKSPQPECPT